MKSRRLLPIGEFAARADVGVQTLHYYERLGLLPKPDRSAANYRLYPPSALRRVQFIKQAQALGFSLEEIREILGLRERGRAPCRRVADVARQHLRELDARIAALREFRKSLAAVVPRWEKEAAGQRRCAGEFCDLIEQLTGSKPAPAAGEKKIKKKPLTLPLLETANLTRNEIFIQHRRVLANHGPIDEDSAVLP